jgi:hypothetical protein
MGSLSDRRARHDPGEDEGQALFRSSLGFRIAAGFGDGRFFFRDQEEAPAPARQLPCPDDVRALHEDQAVALANVGEDGLDLARAEQDYRTGAQALGVDDEGFQPLAVELGAARGPVEVAGGSLRELPDAGGSEGVEHALGRESGELDPAALGEDLEQAIGHAQRDAGPARELALGEPGSALLGLADRIEDGQFPVVEIRHAVFGHCYVRNPMDELGRSAMDYHGMSDGI